MECGSRDCALICLKKQNSFWKLFYFSHLWNCSVTVHYHINLPLTFVSDLSIHIIITVPTPLCLPVISIKMAPPSIVIQACRRRDIFKIAWHSGWNYMLHMEGESQFFCPAAASCLHWMLLRGQIRFRSSCLENAEVTMGMRWYWKNVGLWTINCTFLWLTLYEFPTLFLKDACFVW